MRIKGNRKELKGREGEMHERILFFYMCGLKHRCKKRWEKN